MDSISTPHVCHIQKGRMNKPHSNILIRASKLWLIKLKAKLIRTSQLWFINAKAKIDKDKQVVTNQKPRLNNQTQKDQRCHHCGHCGANGHWKRNCPLYLKELRESKYKKSEHGVADSCRLLMIELFNSTHKLNFGYMILQGFKLKRKLSYVVQYLQVGNGAHAVVKTIGTFNLVLLSGLICTFYC